MYGQALSGDRLLLISDKPRGEGCPQSLSVRCICGEVDVVMLFVIVLSFDDSVRTGDQLWVMKITTWISMYQSACC